MKITLANILGSEGIIVKLRDVPMKAQDSWKLLKIAKVVAAEIDDFNKIKEEKLRKYGTEDAEKGLHIDEDSENVQVYLNELNEVLGSEVEVTVAKLPIDILDNVDVSMADLANAEWMFKE